MDEAIGCQIACQDDSEAADQSQEIEESLGEVVSLIHQLEPNRRMAALPRASRRDGVSEYFCCSSDPHKPNL